MKIASDIQLDIQISSSIESKVRGWKLLQRPLLHVILPADRLDLGVLCVVNFWANESLSVNPIVIEEPNWILVSFLLAPFSFVQTKCRLLRMTYNDI